MHLRGRDEAALAMKAVTANVLVAENVSYPIANCINLAYTCLPRNSTSP